MVEIKLIDFEYAAFGPEEYDLANIFNELILDNNYAYYPYIRAYFENCASIDEVKCMIREYLTLKYKSDETLIENNFELHMKNFFKCVLLNNLYWSFWAVLQIKDKDINGECF
mgnify:CR=1 FL=1